MKHNIDRRTSQISQLYSDVPGSASTDDHFALDDAENPLQLLARASDISGPSNMVTFASNQLTSYPAPRQSNGVQNQDLHTFFGPFRPSLDIEEDSDPIELGLVTEEESEALFS